VKGVLDACIDEAVTALGGVPGPGDPEANCQSKKVKHAGKYMKCKLGKLSKAIKTDSVPDPNSCEVKLATKWGNWEANLNCSPDCELEPIKADLDHCYDLVAGMLDDPNFECVDASDCDDENACTTDSCNLTNQCVNEAISCDDINECTVDSCDPGTGCVNSNVADGTVCNGCDSPGACLGGVCDPNSIDYAQSFETLDQASPTGLSDDCWQVFGNVFGLDWAYWYGYGPFPAPNGGPAFCAIASGEGGPEQEAQQLVVYSDYDNGNHPSAWIEANVFQERTIGAGQVGQTVTFAFDAKLGDIQPDSTAFAFIKTLVTDPCCSVDVFLQEEMTAIPGTWGPYSISLDITPDLVGQAIQYGFMNYATNYTPSGILYDNVVVSTAPTP
jgi:hypothetical protein